ncbi:MAG: alpha/beta fold hydrolase [bacterium]|nr:alpha/beta fold hydrolase [bacterium]
MKLFRKAILLVHGFAGGVYDAEYLDHYLELVPQYDVYTFTLPAHDGNSEGKLKYTDWIEKSESEVEFLIEHGYKKIYVIGHSMGGVIATYLASKYKEIKKLVLVAPAFRFISFEDGNFKLLSAIKKTPKLLEQHGAKIITSRMTKLPANAILEFMSLVKKYQNIASEVVIPTLIFRGTSDQIVPEQSVEHVYNTLASPKKRVVLLEEITHDIFREAKKQEAKDLIIRFFKNTKSMKNFPEIVK